LKHVWVVSLLLLVSTCLFAESKKTVTINVVDAKTWDDPRPFTVPGTPSRSDTNCTGSIDGSGGIYQNCTTTTTPGTPNQTYDYSVAQVELHVIMPDGSKIKVWCQQQFRRCSNLHLGAYQAEINGRTIWIYAYRHIGGPRYTKDGEMLPAKVHRERIKYQIE